MSAVAAIIETEQERVERWRAEELLRAGFDPAAAAELAARFDVDLHAGHRAARPRLPAGARPTDSPQPAPPQALATWSRRVATRSERNGCSASETGKNRSCDRLVASIPSPPMGVDQLAVHDPHVRADAAAGRSPPAIWLTGRPLGALGRRLGPRLPDGGLGRHLRASSARALYHLNHELEPGRGDPRALVRAVAAVWSAGLGIWGAIPFGVRWCVVVRRSGNSVRADDGRRRAGPPARAGDRPLGQLLEPGALRQAHDASLGARDPRQGPRRNDVPPDVPLRVHRGTSSAYGVLLLDRPPLQIKPPGAVRPVRRRLHGVPHLRGDAAASTRRTTSSAMRINFWVSLVVFICSPRFFVWWQFVRKPKAQSRSRVPADRRRGRGWRSRRAASGSATTLQQ